MEPLLDVLFTLMGRDEMETMAYDGVVSLVELVTEQRAFASYKGTLLKYIDEKFSAASVYP